MKTVQEIKIIEKFQEECQQTVEDVLKRSKIISYQEATNVWLFNKLAQMEIRLQELENANPIFNQ